MVIAGVLSWVSWNAFLALLPVAIAYLIVRLMEMRETDHQPPFGIIIILICIWLVLLPNTCYLLTEWRHFLEMLESTNLYGRWMRERDPDSIIRLISLTVFFIGYSLFGIVTFMLGTRPLAHLASRRHLNTLFLGCIFFPLMSLGVYLGLVLRLNSWDIVTRPSMVGGAMVKMLSNPYLIVIVIMFAAFLWLSYWLLDIWTDGFLLRWQQWRHNHVKSKCPDMNSQ